MNDSDLWQIIYSLQNRLSVLEQAAGVTPPQGETFSVKAPEAHNQDKEIHNG